MDMQVQVIEKLYTFGKFDSRIVKPSAILRNLCRRRTNEHHRTDRLELVILSV